MRSNKDEQAWLAGLEARQQWAAKARATLAATTPQPRAKRRTSARPAPLLARFRWHLWVAVSIAAMIGVAAAVAG